MVQPTGGTCRSSSVQSCQAGIIQPAARQAAASWAMQAACVWLGKGGLMLITLISLPDICMCHRRPAYSDGCTFTRQLYARAGRLLQHRARHVNLCDSFADRAASRAHAVYSRAAIVVCKAVIAGRDAHACDVAIAIWCRLAAPGHQKVSGWA